MLIDLIFSRSEFLDVLKLYRPFLEPLWKPLLVDFLKTYQL